MPAKRSGGRLGALSPSAAVRVFWMIWAFLKQRLQIVCARRR